MSSEEQRISDGLAELVRDKPYLGRIDFDAVVARSGSGGSPRTKAARWLTLAAVLAAVAGLGVGLWLGIVHGSGTNVITARPTPPTTPLVGSSWLVTQIRGSEAVVDTGGHVPSLTFEDEDSVSGNDPCNKMSGSYRIAGDRLTLTDLTSTEIGCAPFKQQSRYHGALADVSHFTVRDSTLTLSDGAGRSILVFRAAADPSPTPVDTVQVRIRNESDVNFDKVVVTFGRGSVDYGPVAAGGVSDYERAGLAYHYAAVRATVGSRILARDIIDYTGETPLPPGHYTYVLVAGGGSLELRFEADQ